MRRYLFGTGLLSAITGGITLLRGLREQQFTWRSALAWLSWAISLALAIGAVVDVRRAQKGAIAPADSPVHGQEAKIFRKSVRR